MRPSLLTDPRGRTRRPRTWSIRTSFWLVVAAQVVLFAGSNLPTPLFPLYEQRYGFGSGTVTLIFGIYVATLVPTLLLLGTVADRIGRRPLLAGGIGLTVVSSAVFLAAQGLGSLIAGEVIYGVASAMVMSCVAAAIRELHPGDDVERAALAGSVAAAVGLTVGPLLSGLLATATPWPTASPFLVDILVATALAAALVGIPETRPSTRPRTMSSSRSSILQLPPGARASVRDHRGRGCGELLGCRMGVRAGPLLSASRARCPHHSAGGCGTLRRPCHVHERDYPTPPPQASQCRRHAHRLGGCDRRYGPDRHVGRRPLSRCGHCRRDDRRRRHGRRPDERDGHHPRPSSRPRTRARHLQLLHTSAISV